MDPNISGGAPLQFDTAVPRVAPTAVGVHGVSCTTCQRTIADEYFDVNGQSVCATCRDQLERLTVTPREWSMFVRAALLGLVAAVLGAMLYYAVIAITNFEIGLVAIAIGYMVGWAVRRATAGRGGRRFQVLALVLTYWAVGLAYTPLTFQQITESNKKEAQAAAATPDAQPAEAESDGQPVSIILALGIVLLSSLALPVLMVIGSLPGGLISAAIIAFGMQQAWRMTGTPPLLISGPYRIAAAPPSSI